MGQGNFVNDNFNTEIDPNWMKNLESIQSNPMLQAMTLPLMNQQFPTNQFDQ